MSEPSYSQTTALPSDGPENLLARIANNTAVESAVSGLTDTQLRATPVPVDIGSASVTVNASDIEIGAVELKDAGTDARANILAANTARTTATVVLATQHVGADGKVGGADGADATQGITTGAKVITDNNGTLQQYLRGLVYQLIKGQGTAANSLSVVLSSDGPFATNFGLVADAAVAAGASGSLLAQVRRLTTDLDAFKTATHTDLIAATPAGANAIGSVLGTVKSSAATYSPSRFQNLGANATLNIKASTGNVFSISCYNANAAARYVQLHNTATVPTTTVTVPIDSFLVPPSSQIVIGADYFTTDGCNFATGIAFAFSTTRDVYTAGSAADQSTYVQYK